MLVSGVFCFTVMVAVKGMGYCQSACRAIALIVLVSGAFCLHCPGGSQGLLPVRMSCYCAHRVGEWKTGVCFIVLLLGACRLPACHAIVLVSQ